MTGFVPKPPKFEESDLVDRWSPMPIFSHSKHALQVPKTYTREKTVNKIRQLTEGRFFFAGSWVQFEEECDYVAFKLGTFCTDV